MRGGAVRGGFKKYKPIPTPPYGAGLKSHPIPGPLPLRGGENLRESKQRRVGQVGRGEARQNCHLMLSIISN